MKFLSTRKKQSKHRWCLHRKRPICLFYSWCRYGYRQFKDLENIVVKNRQGAPVLVRDVASVQESTALRYGATTKDGKGEIVCGLALMLKGENSSAVVERVKERMEQINKTLPEGVIAEAFIDRGKLVKSAIGTVTKTYSKVH
jgi:Cu/Ag efflux pump CusA